MNVILTFNTLSTNGEPQEFFEIYMPLSSVETDAFSFIHKKLFKRIVNKCRVLGRDARDLIKISTAGDWDLFEEVTGLPALCSLGHSCKWYFGNGRNDLDPWEKELMRIYDFGTRHDMSYMNNQSFQDEMKLIALKLETNKLAELKI